MACHAMLALSYEDFPLVNYQARSHITTQVAVQRPV
jgi:thymidylate synthase